MTTIHAAAHADEPANRPSAHRRRRASATAAAGLDRKPVEVALAWARDAPGVSATILGARTPAQLRGALAVEDLTLPVQIRHALNEITAPTLGYPERF